MRLTDGTDSEVVLRYDFGLQWALGWRYIRQQQPRLTAMRWEDGTMTGDALRLAIRRCLHSRVAAAPLLRGILPCRFRNLRNG